MMSEGATWTCTVCRARQPAGTIMTYPAMLDEDGVISMSNDTPACCPHCAEGLPPGPFLEWPRESRSAADLVAENGMER